MKFLPILLVAALPACALAQTPPKSAPAFSNSGQEIKLKNPLANLFEPAEGGGGLTIVPIEEIAGRPGAVILDFEPETGWPAAVQELQKSDQSEGWRAFSGGADLPPFQPEEALSPVKIGPTTVTFLPAGFGPGDAKPGIPDAAKSGVFLVKSEGGAMPSGSQGVVAGPRLIASAADGSALGEGGRGLPSGFLLKFDPPVTAAGFVHFNGDIVFAVFGAEDKLLGQIRQGAKPDLVYSYAFEGDTASIHSVFVGNVFPEDGVLDDLVFVP